MGVDRPTPPSRLSPSPPLGTRPAVSEPYRGGMLPYDIIEAIIWFCDREDLFQLLRVSRAFHFASEPILFSQVKLPPRFGGRLAKACRRAFSQKSDLGLQRLRWVRKLTVVQHLEDSRGERWTQWLHEPSQREHLKPREFGIEWINLEAMESKMVGSNLMLWEKWDTFTVSYPFAIRIFHHYYRKAETIRLSSIYFRDGRDERDEHLHSAEFAAVLRSAQSTIYPNVRQLYVGQRVLDWADNQLPFMKHLVISFPALRRLSFRGKDSLLIEDRDLESLGALAHLECLELIATHCTDDFMVSLHGAVPRIQELVLYVVDAVFGETAAYRIFDYVWFRLGRLELQFDDSLSPPGIGAGFSSRATFPVLADVTVCYTYDSAYGQESLKAGMTGSGDWLAVLDSRFLRKALLDEGKRWLGRRPRSALPLAPDEVL